MLKLSVRLLESFSLAIQMLLPYGTLSRTKTISKRLSGHLDRYAETLIQATWIFQFGYPNAASIRNPLWYGNYFKTAFRPLDRYAETLIQATWIFQFGYPNAASIRNPLSYGNYFKTALRPLDRYAETLSQATWIFQSGYPNAASIRNTLWNENYFKTAFRPPWYICWNSQSGYLNLSVWLSKCCFHTEPALIRKLFQNGFPATLIDMLKLWVRLLESFSLAIQMLLPYGTRSRTETISKRLSGHLVRYVETLSSATRTWASSREILSSGYQRKRVSNQSRQLQRLARRLKFRV